MKFSIRDLFLVTMIVAILLAWWVDRTNLAKGEAEAVSKAAPSQEISGRLTRLLYLKNPGAKIEIVVDGSGPSTRTTYGPPNSSAPAPNPPKP